MLNFIWLGLILAAVLIGGFNGTMEQVTTSAINSAETAVMKLALPLIGVMALWLGIMRLAEQSGFIFILARGIRPAMRWLFPEVPADHPATGSMILNIAANMLGLGNAATPFGIRAMKDLSTLAPRPGVATNAMCTFLVINTSSVQLVSATTVSLMAAAGSATPTAFIGTALLATICSTTAGLFAVKLLEKLPMYRLRDEKTENLDPQAEANLPQAPPEADAMASLPKPAFLAPWKKAVLALFLVFFGYLFLAQLFPALQFYPLSEAALTNGESPAAKSLFIRLIDSLALLAIPFILAFFTLFAALSRVSVYEEFVEGAKEGFQIAIRIIPYLVAIMVAIGMFRGAGGIELVSSLLQPVLDVIRVPAEILPLAIMRPLSGSGSLGLLGDLFAVHGPDSFISRMGATIAGSTETTFYVLAVYFGSIGIRRTRHAVPAGLIADFVGICAAIIIATIVFG